MNYKFYLKLKKISPMLRFAKIVTHPYVRLCYLYTGCLIQMVIDLAKKNYNYFDGNMLHKIILDFYHMNVFIYYVFIVVEISVFLMIKMI